MSAFTDRVLSLCRDIPRGKVTTYRSMAKRLGYKCPRPIGNALHRNTDIPNTPCHRVVSSNRSLGGYVNGVEAKRKLLEAEGVKFDEEGRVLPEFIIMI
jgi:methylated-DNA-[protein]-cysteine S-methyltransferase